MTTHDPSNYRFGEVLVSVDNRTATKVSVWYASEDTPRKRFSGDDAYQDAMNFAQDLDYELGDGFVPVVSNEAIAIALGGIPADDDSDY